jgi:hypothetical protein
MSPESKLYCIFVLLISLNGCASSNKTSAPTNNTTPQTAQLRGTGVLVIKQIGFKNDAYIRDAVKKECDLIGKLTQFIEENATAQYAKIITDSTSVPNNAQVLTIEIEQVESGGGGWSGRRGLFGGRGGRNVGIKGKLTQQGKQLGSFKGLRYSGGGAFGGFKGTCAILGRCVRTLGKDVAEWLANPTSNASLGDF